MERSSGLNAKKTFEEEINVMILGTSRVTLN